MAGNKCEYINCDRTRRSEPSLKMFRFPQKDWKRANKWIINSGNSSLLNLSHEELHTRYVCEYHFTTKDFLDSVKKNRLTIRAIPQPYNSTGSPEELRVLIPQKTYSKCKIGIKRKLFSIENEDLPLSPASHPSPSGSTLDDIINLPSPKQMKLSPVSENVDKNYHENIIKKQKEELNILKEKNVALKRKLASKTVSISKLKKRITVINQTHSLQRQLNSYLFPMKESRTVVQMQMQQKKRKWSEREKKFALALFYKSPQTYKYLRSQIVLPSVETIRKWIAVSKFLPGLNNKLFMQIKHKSMSMSIEERKCVICFDEMSLKEYLEYSKSLDLVEGFEDLGHRLGRTNKTARYALVFLARGLFSSWKLPIAYFVSHSGVNGVTLRSLLLDVLLQCFSSGLIPLATVCDQGSSNQSCMKLLNVTEEKPYFDIEIKNDTKKIAALYDTPHLIKSFRNNLLNGSYINNGKIISFEDIKAVYELDKNKTCRALIKLTENHLYPNTFQRMNVKLATQIFSHTVSSAIRTCIETGELKSTSARNTADFVELMNNVFDCLNSKKFRTKNPYNCSLHKKHPLVKDTLQESISFFKNLWKIDKNGKLSQPPCFYGILQTINGILWLYNNENCETEDKYLLTSKTNQDVLENLFSVFRQRGGYNPNPTVKIFRSTFRINTINNLIRPPSSSTYGIADDDLLELNEFVQYNNVAEGECNMPKEAEISSPSGSTSSSTSSSQSSEKENLEECSIKYFAGYLARRILQKHNCDNCRNELLTQNIFLTDKNELFIFHKTYKNIIKDDQLTGLLAPSQLLTKVVKCSLKKFHKDFDNICFKKFISKKILQKIEVSVTKLNWYDDEHSDCNIYRKELLIHLITTKLFKECKNISLKKDKSRYSSQKMKIIQNL